MRQKVEMAFLCKSLWSLITLEKSNLSKVVFSSFKSVVPIQDKALKVTYGGD